MTEQEFRESMAMFTDKLVMSVKQAQVPPTDRFTIRYVSITKVLDDLRPMLKNFIENYKEV